jgi:hypothetical protein
MKGGREEMGGTLYKTIWARNNRTRRVEGRKEMGSRSRKEVRIDSYRTKP